MTGIDKIGGISNNWRFAILLILAVGANIVTPILINNKTDALQDERIKTNREAIRQIKTETLVDIKSRFGDQLNSIKEIAKHNQSELDAIHQMLINRPIRLDNSINKLIQTQRFTYQRSTSTRMFDNNLNKWRDYYSQADLLIILDSINYIFYQNKCKIETIKTLIDYENI